MGSTVFMGEEALRKRKERAEWTRKESVAAPDLFGSADADLDDEALRKRKERAEWKRKESVATPNLFGSGFEEGDGDGEDVEAMRYEIGKLKSALNAKERELDWMREMISDLKESKTNLAIKSNRCMEQMREYLLHYQRSLQGTHK